MGYRIRLDESVGKGLARVVKNQVELGLTELALAETSPDGVHKARKTLKRLRALLRLAGPGSASNKWRQHNTALRDIGRLLSPKRDEMVMAQTLAKLRAAAGGEAVANITPLRDSTAQTASIQADRTLLSAEDSASSRALLANTGGAIAKMKYKRRGFALIEKGLEDSYRRGRDALKVTYRMPSNESFHELRKAVQLHWRQMSLLSRAWPEYFEVRVFAARELSQALGEAHDLAMLEDRPDYATNPEFVALKDVISEQRSRLTSQSQFKAERLFAETPGAFVRRIKAYWSTGRHLAGKTAPAGEAQHMPPLLSGAEAETAAPIAAKTLVRSPSRRRA